MLTLVFKFKGVVLTFTILQVTLKFLDDQKSKKLQIKLYFQEMINRSDISISKDTKSQDIALKK